MMGAALDPYRIVDRLGPCGMGEIYRAMDAHLKRGSPSRCRPRRLG
ncbi:MAG TPA: hypothetical protein VLD67_00105 [Vicinamibacterales bacterium]|nr:hypothetical protein [Vicinamibacterales bacterium]